MYLSPVDRKIVSILAIFETGKPDGYGAYADVPGDSGGVSIGMFQASLTSGNAGLLLQQYSSNGGAVIDNKYITMAVERDPALGCEDFYYEWNMAAQDPIMQETQQVFFYEQFVVPAIRWCHVHAPSLDYPLSHAVVADGYVHGGLRKVGAMVTERKSEFGWIAEYLVLREKWLATNPNPLLHKTLYRPHFFLDLVASQNWTLESPFVCQGHSFE